jgi:hypothetical protein
MAYTPVSPQLAGIQAIANTDTVQNHALGFQVLATDPTYGTGEFVYLKGVASTAVGSVVIYDQYAGTTTLTVAGSRGPVAVAMSANVANQYGWYQVTGAAVTKCGTVAANTPQYVTATAGSTDDAVVAGDKIDSFVSKTANGTPSAGLLIAQIARPSLNGNG